MGPGENSTPQGRRHGMDFLQSASNMAADTVAGPVDLLAMGLRGVGVPVPQNPVGGTEWMTQRGLRRDVPMGGARIAGETAGLVSPAALFAKAPQVAAALNQAGRNLAAPRTLNPQTGAIVWHGSPHKFDAFDSSKIGTGEGAQAYGHGLYLAESPDVAGSYAKMNPSSTVRVQRVWPNRDMPDGGYEALATRDSGPLVELGAFRTRAEADAAAEAFRREAENLYKVDLPDDKIARMLDWDRPLSQQAGPVREALERRAGFEIGSFDEASKATYMRPKHKLALMTGGDYVQSANLTHGGPSQFSKVLRESGIPGIRYLDGSSRGTGAGTSNFVVFPGEENALRILERNGQPLLFGR